MAFNGSQFCPGELWNLNLTWFSETPDFTPCFHKTILVYVPCAFVWLFSPLEIRSNFVSTSRLIPWTWLNISKIVSTGLLAILSILELVRFSLLKKDELLQAEIVGADFASSSVKLATYLLAIILVLSSKRAGRVTSAIQFLFWTLLAICQGITFGSVVNHDQVELSLSTTSDVMYIVGFVLIFFNFCLHCFADKTPAYRDFKEQNFNRSPELGSSFINRLLFVWFDKTIWNGRKKTIEQSDLWDLNPEDSIHTIVPNWDRLWDEAQKKHREHGTAPPGVLMVLLRAFGMTFLTGGVWQLAYVLLQFVSPLLLNLIISFVQGDDPVWRGYLYTVVLSGAALLAAMADSQYWYNLNLFGLRLKTALSTAIYKKSLQLSNAARKEKNAGDIVNMINVDCQKLIDACLFVNMMWSCPLQVGLSIFFLYNTIGVAVFVGLGVLLILFPVNAVIWAVMEKYQTAQMLKKDQRVRLISEILNGIKVLKLYAWELSFVKRINSLREEEVHQLRVFQFLEGTQYFVWSSAPLIVALASFVTFVLIDPINNILDSQTAFVSLTLFNTMRGPLFLLPFGIVSLIQGAVSIKRINSFLNAEDLDKKSVSHNKESKHPVTLHHASFKWNPNPAEPTTLRSLSWSVPEGALVAVVGTVGSGKSSLLSALLGEMIRMEGEANVRGKVAYVPQQAWMRNATLKNNILFGKNFKPDVYDKVIEACALKPDLEILTGGDQTEIGEKGINLSGGQKQRVSLARAVYNNADLYLLDDPLSAVDSHVGKHIFEKVIGPKGALRKKTRILVTHGIGYLPQMDQIVVLKEGKISEIGTYDELMNNRGAFAEFLIEQLQGQDSGSSMSESEMDDIRLKLEETLGPESLAVKLQSAKKSRSKKNKSAAKRVRTTSIGSISDYISDPESVFSLSNTDISTGRPHRRRSQAVHSRQGSIARSGVTTLGGKNEENHQRKGSGEFQVGRDLIEDETAETDRVKFEIYVYYAKAIGVALSVASVGLYACFQFFNIFGNFWLSIWSGDVEAATNTALRNKYMAIYGTLGLLQALAVLLAVIVVTIGTLRASVKLHKEMLEHILLSTMAFFDTTPIGRIINRFSKDIDEVDLMIPTHIKDILTDFFSVIGTLFVVCYASPIIIAVVVPLIFIFFFIQNSYLAVSRQLKRMVSVTRSPINSSLTESYSGAATIRAFKMESTFIAENAFRVEANQQCYYPEVASNSWLFSRLEMLSNLLIIFTSLFAVIYRDTMDPGLVGLSLTYTFTFQLDIFLMTRYVAELEKSIVSVERIREYQNTPIEAPFDIPENDPPKSWPENGVIEFDNYATRYREGLDLVLKGVSFRVEPTEKVGIVGRTGAGKSSLTLSLFRIIEGASGSINIDGINIAHLGLSALRSALTIIPQDPVLFSGSMRFNLDPFNRYSDPDLWRTLEHAHLRHFVSQLPDGLDYEVSEGGENLSVGQRQLVCLARALLRKTKVLVLDEATAAVDLETDDLIQATIRQEFQDCTVLTIAHRLKTIMDSDKILVLDAGKVCEFDSPENLLDDPHSMFYSMARDAGLAS